MALYDHFGQDPNPGFIRSVDPDSARRQLCVSVGVALVLAAAIGGSAFALRPASGFDTASQRAAISDAAAVNRQSLDAGLWDRAPRG